MCVRFGDVAVKSAPRPSEREVGSVRMISFTVPKG